MSKKCPRNCGIFEDTIRKCPKCGSFLIKLNIEETKPQPINSQPPTKKTQPQTSSPTQTAPKPVNTTKPPTSSNIPDPLECYPMKTLPFTTGRVKNIQKSSIKRGFITKAFESLSTGIPIAKGDTVNTFQVYKQDSYGRDVSVTNVILRGDIEDGILYEGNEVRVWGKAPKNGSLRASVVFNKTSNTLVTISGGIPAFMIWATLIIIGILIVIGIINAGSFSALFSLIFEWIIIILVVMIGGKIFLKSIFKFK